MKKSKLIILLLLTIIVNFLFKWFSLEIDRFAPFLGLIIGLICFVSFIYILNVLIRKFINKEDVVVNSICFCILIIYLVFRLVFPFIFIKSKLEMKFYENDRIEIVNKIKNGEINSNSEKTIYLS